MLSSCTRYACKIATGTGKTTVMGMLAAWAILNRVAALNRAGGFGTWRYAVVTDPPALMTLLDDEWTG